MAPEKLFKSCSTTKADMWSLGCILCFVIMGYLPFQYALTAVVGIGETVGYARKAHYLVTTPSYSEKYPLRDAFPELQKIIRKQNWTAINVSLNYF